MKFMDHVDRPLPLTLASWAPRCNAQGLVRIKLDFELPLTDLALASMPIQIQNVAEQISILDNGITEADISLEFDASVDLFETNENTAPSIQLPPCQLKGLVVFRPTPAEGNETNRFLWFTTTIPAGGDFGHRLAAWALDHMSKVLFMRTHETQANLPGMGDESDATPPSGRAAKKAPAKRSGKDAAAGSDE
jgi:hypothetical protein